MAANPIEFSGSEGWFLEADLTCEGGEVVIANLHRDGQGCALSGVQCLCHFACEVLEGFAEQGAVFCVCLECVLCTDAFAFPPKLQGPVVFAERPATQLVRKGAQHGFQILGTVLEVSNGVEV